MNTGVTTDRSSEAQSARRRDRDWWLKLACATIIAIVVGYYAIGLASLPRYVHRVSTLTVPELQFGEFVISNGVMLQQAAARGLPPRDYALYQVALGIAFLLLCVVVATVVLWRARQHWFGWFTAVVLLFLGSYPLLEPMRTAQLLPTFWQEIGGIFWPLYFLYVFLFPNGRAVPYKARWLVGTLCLVFLLLLIVALTTYIVPDLLSEYVEVFLMVGISVILSNFVIILICQLYRYRRVSNVVERQQTKWFVSGLAAIVVLNLIDRFPNIGEISFDQELSLFSLAILPITIAIAITRYRLFDIDVIINRTLVHGTLTAMLALVYFGSVFGLQRVLAPFIGPDSDVATIVSTLAIAALFSPLRRRIQTIIDRRFYRRKYDAAQVLAAFGMTARDEVDLDRLTNELLAVVEETLQPEHVSLWLREAPTRVRSGVDGSPSSSTRPR